MRLGLLTIVLVIEDVEAFFKGILESIGLCFFFQSTGWARHVVFGDILVFFLLFWRGICILNFSTVLDNSTPTGCQTLVHSTKAIIHLDNKCWIYINLDRKNSFSHTSIMDAKYFLESSSLVS